MDLELHLPCLRMVLVSDYDVMENRMKSRFICRAAYLFGRMPRIREVRFDPARLPT